MSTSQPRRHSGAATSDSLDTTLIIVDGWGDPPTPFRPLSPQERLESRKVVDSYAVEPEKILRVKKAAIFLGRSKADLICEALDLLLEKYHDQLGDLDSFDPFGQTPKPEDVPPSA